MSVEGMGPCLAVAGATKAVFETYVERVLAPSLLPGQVVVVVVDDLSAHKGERVREPVEEEGCEPSFLPAYPPDLNPTEEAFSKAKDPPRRAEARAREAPIGAVGKAPTAVTAQGACGGFFEHCGHRRAGQLP